MKNTNKLFILAAVLLLVSSVYSQFKWTAGGPQDDNAMAISQTSNGGYWVSGYTKSYGFPGQNAYLLKFNSSGSLQFSRAFGGSGTDYAYSVVNTTDGGCAVAGWTNSYGQGGYDIYITKFDASGTIQWNRIIGGSDNDYAYSIIQSSDGGFVVTGQTATFGAGNIDVIILKLSSVGNILWTRTAGYLGNESGYNIIETSDGGYAIAGVTSSYGAGGNDMFIIKTNSNGIVLWSRVIGGSTSDEAFSIIQLSDGSFVAAGSTISYGAGSYDMYVVKFNSSGQLIWTRTIGASGYEFAGSVVQAADGVFIISGSTESFGAGGADFYAVKLNASGTIQWQKTVGGSGNDYGYRVISTSDGGFCSIGNTSSYGAGGEDFFMVKYSSNGSVCGSSFVPAGLSGSGGSIISVTPLSFPYSPQSSTPNVSLTVGGNSSTICLTGIEQLNNQIPDKFTLLQNYPNPFNPSTKIGFSLPVSSSVSIRIFDAAGKEVKVLADDYYNAGNYEIDFNGEGLSSGTYFYRMNAGDFTDVKKLCLIK